MKKRKAKTITTKLAMEWANAAARSPCILGFAVDRRARLRAPCRQPRSENGGAARRHSAGMEACQALCLQRLGDRCVADGGVGPAARGRAASMDLPTLFGLIVATGMRL